jgi:hypothetical protein
VTGLTGDSPGGLNSICAGSTQEARVTIGGGGAVASNCSQHRPFGPFFPFDIKVALPPSLPPCPICEHDPCVTSELAIQRSS